MTDLILIIDDNEDDREIMGTSLRKSGINNIIFAKNGEEGLSIAREKNPALIVTDTNLPGFSGFEICKLIKDEFGEKTKVIVMTGLIDAVDAIKAREMGADDYCVKTSDYEHLIDTIKTQS